MGRAVVVCLQNAVSNSYTFLNIADSFSADGDMELVWTWDRLA